MQLPKPLMPAPVLVALSCLAAVGCGGDTAPAGSGLAETAAPPAAGSTSTTSRPAPAAKDTSDTAQVLDTAEGHTHCRPGEATVFSCTLEDTRRTVSLCLAHPGEPNATARFVSGLIGAPDITISREDAAGSGALFERTPLTFAGGTGGYAYSFEQSGQVQILYSISGSNGLERQGWMLTDAAVSTAAVDHVCASGTVVQSDDIDMLRQVRRWPAQPRLATNGLPPVVP